MQRTFLLYRLLLPLYVLLALPAWLAKTARRGGFGSGLLERAGCYDGDLEFEPAGAVHVHSVSVGETLLAMKLIRAWKLRDPDRKFVLAVGTPTGKAVAMEHPLEGVRVVYQPVDFRFMVRRYLKRFEPSQVVLVEGEMWPNLLTECGKSGIPVRLVNARMSPRSRSRYERFASWIRPIYSKLDAVVVQEEEHAAIWEVLGVRADRISVAGSLKFDPGSGKKPAQREEFAEMLAGCVAGRPVVLAASTHAGEEALIGRAVRDGGGFLLSVPRHAERRHEVAAALEAEGFDVVLRSRFRVPEDPSSACLVVDSTGELRDWTAHADAVVIGKSFLGVGGQNPAEAIQARKPLLYGPHMENFEPLVTRLVEQGGARRVEADDLSGAIKECLGGSADEMTAAAARVLSRHEGATGRTLEVLIADQER